MPLYRIEISARAFGWVDVEASDEEAAIASVRADWSSADFDAHDGPIEIEGVEESDD